MRCLVDKGQVVTTSTERNTFFKVAWRKPVDGQPLRLGSSEASSSGSDKRPVFTEMTEQYPERVLSDINAGNFHFTDDSVFLHLPAEVLDRDKATTKRAGYNTSNYPVAEGKGEYAGKGKDPTKDCFWHIG